MTKPKSLALPWEIQGDPGCHSIGIIDARGHTVSIGQTSLIFRGRRSGAKRGMSPERYPIGEEEFAKVEALVEAVNSTLKTEAGEA